MKDLAWFNSVSSVPLLFSIQEGSETPQERLKRLMAAQISKQQARDTVSVRQRQQAEARDAAARRQIERTAMSIERRHSPSPSPRCVAPAGMATMLPDC